MTETVAKADLRRVKRGLAAMLVLAALNTVLILIAVFGILPRLQARQDELAVAQVATRNAAVDTQQAAEATERVLLETIRAVEAGSPQTAYTRAQVDALCRMVLDGDCPPSPPELTTTTTTVGDGR